MNNTATTFTEDRAGTGTKEWSDHSYNISLGCAHDCGYCYARSIARHFGRIARISDWAEETLIPEKVAAASRRFSGVVMFPTTHDITPGLLPAALQTLRGLLAAGNSVLVVSKPHLDVVRALCMELVPHQANLQFRFTIGSGSAATCALWEPGAPPPEERISALGFAFEQGYATSVSMEPMLEDNDAMCALVARVDPLVTGTIWLGKMNGGISREIQAKPRVGESLLKIRAGQSDEQILRLHDRLQSNPKVRWKDSIKQVLQAHGRLAAPPMETIQSSVDPANAAHAKRSAAAKKTWVTINRNRAQRRLESN